MTDVITDEVGINISIKTHANISISNLQFPLNVYANKPFDASYIATNIGGEDECYGEVTDDDNGDAVIVYQEMILPAQSQTPITLSLTLQVIGIRNLTLRVGYLND